MIEIQETHWRSQMGRDGRYVIHNEKYIHGILGETVEHAERLVKELNETGTTQEWCQLEARIKQREDA